MKKLLSIALLLTFVTASQAIADQKFSGLKQLQTQKKSNIVNNKQYKHNYYSRNNKPNRNWQQRDRYGNIIDRNNYYNSNRNYPSKRFYGGRYYNDPYYTEQYYGTRETYGPYREYYEEYYHDPYYSGYREYHPRRPRLEGYCPMPGFTLRFYANSNCVIHKDHFHCD